MTQQRPIAASDLTWLHMDSPTNLMIINGILWFDEAPSWEAVRATVRERLLERYPELSDRPVHHLTGWTWQPDPDFDFERHVQLVRLKNGADLRSARAYLSRQLSQPFDHAHPMWRVVLVVGPDDSGPGIVYTQFHHCIADGIRLVQLLLSMCDTDVDAAPKAGKRGGVPGTLIDRTSKLALRAIANGVDVARGLGRVARRTPQSLAPTLNPLHLPHQLETGFDMILHPVKATDAVTSIGSVDNEISNSVREVSRVLLATRSDKSVWEAKLGIDKQLHWCTGIDLDEIRSIGSAFGGTINDVLLSIVARALAAYLKETGSPKVREMTWMMPVSLQPIDTSPTSRLGNHFSVVLLTLPLGISDHAALIKEIASRTTRIKHSAEPVVTFGMQRMLAETPHLMAINLTRFFAHKTVGQLTNVPGPRAPMRFGGKTVKGVLGFVPMTADQPVGLCIFSYNNAVNIGISSDKGVIRDGQRLADLIELQVDEFAQAAEGAETV